MINIIDLRVTRAITIVRCVAGSNQRLGQKLLVCLEGVGISLVIVNWQNR